MADPDELYTKVKKRRIYQDVAERIRDLVDDGILKPGDQLPPERELSERFGVSRTSVREAIRTMELLGEVETRIGVNGGTFIREVSIGHAMDVFQSLFRRTNQLVSDIVEVRLILETRSAYFAATRRTPQHLTAIYEAIAEMDRSIRSGSIGTRGDHEFHLAVAQASENDFLYGLSQLIEDLAEDTRRQTLSEPGVPEEALEDHQRIAEAISDQDASKAEEAMRTHLLKAYEISRTKGG